jgi:regulator of PEP synthase PpsR (kinase-PPPase family)
MADDHLIYAVSDSTGETAEQAASAALAQFGPRHHAHVRIFGHIRDEDELAKVVERARERNALIVYTLVEPELRLHMASLTQQGGVTAVDLLGNMIRELSRYLGLPPLYLPGLGHETDEEYFRRIEAVEFSVYNDDGRLPENLTKADLVLVGISRTSKTPLSNYIAHRGYKVANMPLVKGQEPPHQLDEVDPRRVFALVVDPGVLVNIRRARLDAMGVQGDSSYGDLAHVREEMAWARRIFREHPEWTVVDITERAIEETASDVLEAFRDRFERPARDAASKG